MKIKICGLRRPEDIRLANLLQPDYIGFVFAPGKRQISVEAAAGFKESLADGIQAAGIFVDETPEKIIRLLNTSVIDVAQLHGSEDESAVRHIKECTGKPVWKAVKVRGFEDIEKWRDSLADCLVLDNGQGTGESFDWQCLKETGRRYFLAGGICADNIEEAVCRVRPFGIDVSSGVETAGAKDAEKMKYIIRYVRDYGGNAGV